MLPVPGDRCDRYPVDLFVADRSNRSLEEGLSTGPFDQDRADLSCDSVPKVGSPGEGFGPRGIASKTVAEA